MAGSEWKEERDGDSVWQSIQGKDCEITLQARPHYCDRGNFLARLDARGDLAQEIDDSDLWPRYYFDEERAKLEVEAWLKKRGQFVDQTVNNQEQNEGRKNQESQAGQHH